MKPNERRELSRETRLIHATEEPAYPHPSVGVSAALEPSSTFAFEDAAALSAAGTGRLEAAFYARYSHPNARQVERALAALEGAEAAAVFSSGLAAIHTAWVSQLSPGDRLCVLEPVYGGTLALAEGFARWGVHVDVVPMHSPERITKALAGARLLHLEALTNPTLRIPDLAGLAARARELGIVTLVDATLVSPCFVRPLELGFSLVMHSVTKYLGGHGDLLGGVICGEPAAIEAIAAQRRILGNILSADSCWRLLRSLKTLPLRMARIEATAGRIAGFLRSRPEVELVHDPRDPGHPEHGRGQRWFSGFGGIVTFDLQGGAAAATNLVDGLRIFQKASSLGGVESLVCEPRTTTHASFDEAGLRRHGIASGCVRLSVGLEDPADLEGDLHQALVGGAEQP